MSGWSVADILDPRFMDEAYQEVTPVGAAPSPMLQFFGANPKSVFGDTIEVTIIPAERTPAPTNSPGHVARPLQTKGVRKRYYTPIHAFNKISIPQQAMLYLEMVDRPDVQNLGREELNRQMEYFKLRHSILREVALSKALFGGVIYRDTDGNVSETDQGGPTIDLGVSSSHKTTLGGIIGTAWDNAAAPILTDLDDIKLQSQVEGKPEPKHIWCNSVVKRWLRDNTEAKAYFQNAGLTPTNVDKILQGDVFPDLGGFMWHFYDATYVDSGGTSRYLCPQTMVTITPEVGPWFRAFNGSFRIPNTEGVLSGDTADAAASNGRVVYGDYLYLRERDDPATLMMYGGTTFLYAFSDPDAIWMPTVDF